MILMGMRSVPDDLGGAVDRAVHAVDSLEVDRPYPDFHPRLLQLPLEVLIASDNGVLIDDDKVDKVGQLLLVRDWDHPDALLLQQGAQLHLLLE
jgi:hypothetical protein